MRHLRIGDHRLEYVWLGPKPEEAPTLVFLHEGLGCVAMWRDFPERAIEATGCGALVYSRAGYGRSDPIELPRPIRFMHDEALLTLPRVLDALKVSEAILVGHSDGGSISLIYAGAPIHSGAVNNLNHGGSESRENKQSEALPTSLLRGLILEAPHVFVEEVGIKRIESIAKEYSDGDLRSRLERYHGKNVDGAFWGWNDVWLDPAFRSWNIEKYLSQIRVPILVIQGEDDRYSTLRQIHAIEDQCPGPVSTVVLEECGHSPHVDQPDRTLAAITKFCSGIPLETR